MIRVDSLNRITDGVSAVFSVKRLTLPRDLEFLPVSVVIIGLIEICLEHHRIGIVFCIMREQVPDFYIFASAI